MKHRILVVDDDEQIRQSLRKVLQAEGHEVVLAADGVQALERFDPQSIDLLLLDLGLPAKSGWDVFERMTFLNPLLPIIVITGRNNQRALATAAGVGALMEKPLDVPRLLQMIAELLREPPDQRLRRLAGFDRSTRYYSRTAASTPGLQRPTTLRRGNPRKPQPAEPV